MHHSTGWRGAHHSNKLGVAQSLPETDLELAWARRREIEHNFMPALELALCSSLDHHYVSVLPQATSHSVADQAILSQRTQSTLQDSRLGMERGGWKPVAVEFRESKFPCPTAWDNGDVCKWGWFPAKVAIVQISSDKTCQEPQ